MQIGILDILVDAPVTSRRGRLYADYFRKQFISIMPQAIAVWCRELGHEVHYATYAGIDPPEKLLPDRLDVVFMATYTQASALAYALAKLYRAKGVTTVIGGPHAAAFTEDAQRFFDFVVLKCDKTLIKDLLAGQYDAPAIVSTGRQLTDFPSVEERMPEIRKSAFIRGRPKFISIAPLLASVGCPYKCDFCIDWNNDYVPLSAERLEQDLRYLADHQPGLIAGFHDPNFAVRFDETMEVMERLPAGRRPRYIMESSLSILKPERLKRLAETNCAYVAPGIESWQDYSNKAASTGVSGQQKLDQVVEHFKLMGDYVPGMQANFLFGADTDSGSEPVELTKAFIRRLPRVFPAINIPTPFGATPLYQSYLRDGRILESMPFAFYYNPYLAITLKNYDPITYYDHLIDLHRVVAGRRALMARVLAKGAPAGIRLIHGLRVFATGKELNDFRRMRARMAEDPDFLAFHEGRTGKLPAYYREELRRRLGRYAELLSDRDLRPDWEKLKDSALRSTRPDIETRRPPKHRARTKELEPV